MSEPELSASEEGIFAAESSNQSASPSKPSRGTNKRGRGKSKRSRKLSSDNDSSSNGLHVSSLKHVGKFRYLSNLTQTENSEADHAKPVASRGKRGNGRGRGRGRSSSNHMTSSLNTSESTNQVSRSGRRIKPNNRWAPDADFDPGPVNKVLPVRQRTAAIKSAKTIPHDKLVSHQHCGKEINAGIAEDLAAIGEPVKQNDSICEDRLVDDGNEIKQRVEEDQVHLPTINSLFETSEANHKNPAVEGENTEKFDEKINFLIPEEVKLSHDTTSTVLVVQDLTTEELDVVLHPPEISVEVVCSNECDEKHILEEEQMKSPTDYVSMQTEPSSNVLTSSQVVSDITENLNLEVTREISLPECNKEVLIHVYASDSTSSEREDSSQGLAVKDNVTEQLYNSSAGNTPRRDDESFDAQSVLISPKPVKVKSRWRRTSELEQVVGRNGNSDQSSCNNSPCSMSPKAGCSLPPLSDTRDSEGKTQLELGENIAIIQERLKSFEIVEENQYLTSRNTSKEVKRMLCDCSLTKEEIARGELGCGEDCINRLLMIECGPRCQLGVRCTNKRFQKRQYAKIEVFNTEKKGVGLRALQDMDPGDFIIEYVGEVIDPREFHRRAKDYAREKNKHYYFMALKSDAIIDATQQGNVSRFINHSCDPNAETQKWTVNGDLRVGFFARKTLKHGDEVTFDYQFQRYGKEAQRCYCESANCRGWIGEDPEKEDKNRDKKEKRDREKRKSRNVFREEVNTIDLESEIERLVTLGVKNRTETLNLSRLMVRVEDFEARKNILTVLRNSEQACRRLFLDYHGLKLLWGWMVDASSLGQSSENLQFKLDLLSTLSSLPVPNKTMLLDSKLISIVEKWSTVSESPSTVEVPKPENSTETEEMVENQMELPNQIISMASQLLDSWSNLKEVFRIPKRERIEKMKEHEREADKEWNMIPDVADQLNKQSSYDRRPNNQHRMDSVYREPKEREKLKRLRDSPDRENRKMPRLEVDNISKEERRRLFALKVAQQDEELRARKCQADVWRRHLEKCLAFGVEPAITPFDCEATPFLASASPGYSIGLPQVIWDPVLGVWQPCSDELGSSSANLSALTPLSETSSTNQAKVSNEPPLLHLVIPKGYNPTIMGPLVMDFDLCKHEGSGVPYVPASLVVPLENDSFHTGPSLGDSTEVPLLPFKLPSFWRHAMDERGRIYYYHVRLRLAQWEPPTAEVDTPDFSSEEEEEVEDAIEPVTSTAVVDSAANSISQNSKEQERERRRSLLCREKIISPRSEFEKSDDAQRYRELKERVLRQKLARIRERGLWIEETKTEEKTKSREKERRKLNEKEKQKMRKRAKEKYKRSLLKVDGRKKTKEPSAKDKVEAAGIDEKDGEAVVNGEGNDIGGERYMMEGSLDDYMLIGEAEDEAGEQERNRNVSANTVRKIKDAFRMKISSDIVNILNPYRRPDCKLGRITCTDDFKHLARKMTHFVLAKELKHCRNIQDLVVNDSVKHKAKDFIKKYMAKFGPAYKRGNDEDA